MATIIRLNFSAYLDPAYPALEQAKLGKLAPYLAWPSASTTEKAAALADTAIVLTNSNTSSALLGEIPQEKIKLLIHPNSGYDNFSPSYVASAKFPMVLGHQLRATAVTEFILACVFQAFTPLPWRTSWDPQRHFPGRNLIAEEHFLLVGFGHIGSQVAQHLTALGAVIDIFDPWASEKVNQAAALNPRLHPVAWAQIAWPHVTGLILAASLNPSSRHLIGPEVVGQLGSRAVLINAARGALIDPAALSLFLAGDQHYAYIDTWENEPHPAFDWHHPRLHASSHVAGVYPTLGDRMLDYLQQVITDEQRLAPASFTQKYQAELLALRLRQDESGQAYFI